MTHRNPALTVDALVYHPSTTSVLLIKRGREPHKGCWAFPGGFVDYGEDPEVAVLRELKEETNLDGKLKGLVSVKGNPSRDPRKHTVTIAYAVQVDNFEPLTAGDDAAHAELVPLQNALSSEMAFDHGEILREFDEWLRASGNAVRNL